jgi:hypothetical protein
MGLCGWEIRGWEFENVDVNFGNGLLVLDVG